MTKDRKSLLREIRLNKEATCSFDEAVGMMLGIFEGPDWFIDVQLLGKLEELNYKEEHKYRENVDFDTSFNLYDYLAEERDDLIEKYFEAKSDNESESVLKKKLDAIEKFDTNRMKKAKVYWCLLEDEFVKKNSKLRFVNAKRITLASLDKWWAKKQQDESVIEHSIFKDMQKNVPKSYDTDIELKGAKIESINVTLGLLLGAFAAQLPEKLDKENFYTFAVANAEKFKSTFKEDNAKKSVLEELETLNVANFLNHLFCQLGISEDTPKQTAEAIDLRLAAAKKAALAYLANPKYQS